MHLARALSTTPCRSFFPLKTPTTLKPAIKAVERRGIFRRTHALGQELSTLAASPSFFADGVSLQAGLIAGGIALVGLLGTTAWNMNQAEKDQSETPKASDSEKPAAPLPRENAVMVVGATGRTGKHVVAQLLKAGRTVVAVSRRADKAGAMESLSEVGIKEDGLQAEGGGILFIEPGVTVTSLESLKRPGLWEGVTQVITTLGPKFGRMPDGNMGYIDDLSPEAVEEKGVVNLLEALSERVPKLLGGEMKTIFPMSAAEDLNGWDRLDDVIMGGNSASAWEMAPEEGPMAAKWKGNLILEGGGFCGSRTKPLESMDWSAYDGIAMRVKGDGQIFKFNVKTMEQLGTPESTYQATFDTAPGQWCDVRIPWHNFVPVKRAQSDPDGAPLDPTKIAKLGLVLSRFEFNKMPNPSYKPGLFELVVDGGINAYKSARPQIIHLTSAGVERNAIVGDDAERRKQQIPIVQLNPGGTLNAKYAGEIAIRASGYPYAVVRSTGMTDKKEGAPFLLEADQGDSIIGAISRDELGVLLAKAAAMPEAGGKTFEVRRNEARDARERAQPMTDAEFLRMFLKLSLDRNRWRVGLQPFPKYVPPPAPVTEERKQEILQQVQRIREERGVASPAEGQGQNGAPPSVAAPPPSPAPAKEPAAAGKN